jgi:Flp pilus assembly protein TadG
MRTTMKTLFKNYLKTDGGVAAIETAFIMPIMLIMYIGMVDLTSLVSMNRKLTQAASTLADVITQSKDTIAESNVADIFNAVDLIMVEGAGDVVLDITVEGYRKVNGVATKQWSKSRGVCTAPVDTTKMLDLMDAGNDIVVAKVCTEFFPFAGNVLGTVVLGADSIKMSEVITERPRISDQLSCYTSSTHTPANLCN